MIHPTVLLLAWLAFALAIPWFSSTALAAASPLIALGVGVSGFQASWRLVRRTRYLLIALILLYTLATPGTPLIDMWATPTQEGLLAGTLQAWRLLLIVTALALLLTHTNHAQLLAGLYGLLTPLKVLGLPRDRIAVRLSLTLQYAEAGLASHSLRERWDEALAPPNAPASGITLTFPAFTWRDLAFVGGISAVLAGALLW